MSLRIIDLVEIERDSFGEVAQGFLDCAALAGDIDLKALRDVPVFFLVYGDRQVPGRIHESSVTPWTPFRLCHREGGSRSPYHSGENGRTAKAQ